jgi:hypothetical protein
MLQITVHGANSELWDEKSETFQIDTTDDVVLELEHSLVSVSKWESKFEKAFLGSNDKTTEEVFGYIEMMILNPNVPSNILTRLSQENLTEINKYIESKQSATKFGKTSERRGRAETITSELVYYWMVAFNIPFECETWHLNRLFSLIQICNVKNAKPEKQSRSAIAQRNRELNEQRRKELGTSG